MDKIKQLVMKRLGVTVLDDDLYDYLEQYATELIKDYCQRNDIPTGLQLILVEVITHLFLELGSVNEKGEYTQTIAKNNDGKITSVSDGNQSVDYETGDGLTTNILMNGTEQLVKMYEVQLNRYRKIRTGSVVTSFNFSKYRHNKFLL